MGLRSGHDFDCRLPGWIFLDHQSVKAEHGSAGNHIQISGIYSLAADVFDPIATGVEPGPIEFSISDTEKTNDAYGIPIIPLEKISPTRITRHDVLRSAPELTFPHLGSQHLNPIGATLTPASILYAQEISFRSLPRHASPLFSACVPGVPTRRPVSLSNSVPRRQERVRMPPRFGGGGGTGRLPRPCATR